MKNFKNIFLTFSILICLFFCFGCSDKPSTQNNFDANISEYRKNLFVGKNSNYLITLTSGERESEYIMDGEPSKLVNFGVLTLKFEKKYSGENIQFELKIDDDVYTGELFENPYDNTYVFDIEKQVSDDSTVTLYLIDFDDTIPLECWSKSWQYSYKDAYEIFLNKHKEEIKGSIINSKLQGEVYIKTVAEDSNLNDIYWYVLLVCKNGDMFASLISVQTGQILQNS